MEFSKNKYKRKIRIQTRDLFLEWSMHREVYIKKCFH